MFRKVFLPLTVALLLGVIAGCAEEQPLEDIPIFKKRKPIKGKATVYLCEGNTCREPVTNPATLVELFQELT